MKPTLISIVWSFLLFFGITNTVLGQTEWITTKIDSTLLTITNKTYSEKKDSYYYISNLIGKKGSKDALSLIEYTLSKDTTTLGKMMLYSRYGQYKSREGDTDGALEIKKQGLAIAQQLKDERLITNYHISVGNTYLYQNITYKALYQLNEAQRLAEKPENNDLLWNVFYNKGQLQNTLGDIEGNTKYYISMWNSIKHFENTSTKRFVLYILVDYFSQLDAPENLTKFTELLSQHYEDAHPNTPEGHMPIKAIFEKRADPSNIPALQKAIRISDSLQSLNSFAYTTIALANTYAKMEAYDKAINSLKYAIAKLERVKKPQILLDLYNKAAAIELKAQDYKSAYSYKNLEISIRDSIKSERMQRNLAELEVKFDTEKKERQIAQQDLEIAKKAKQRNQILVGLIALALLSALTFIFFRKRLKDQRLISAQKEEIQVQEITDLKQKNKLLALNSMIEGQEAERLRIAKDLHDGLGGLLSTVKAHFSTIQKEIEEIEKLNITEKTNHLIDEACIEVRRISHNMMPHALSISGLEGAIEDISENLKEQGYTVTLEINSLPNNLPPTREIMIYRLVQEIISNISKHAHASSILIQLIGYKNEINLIVEDNGKGFDYKAAIKKGGLGLKSINSRVEFLDGKIFWDSTPDNGTSITITIPVLL